MSRRDELLAELAALEAAEADPRRAALEAAGVQDIDAAIAALDALAPPTDAPAAPAGSPGPHSADADPAGEVVDVIDFVLEPGTGSETPIERTAREVAATPVRVLPPGRELEDYNPCPALGGKPHRPVRHQLMSDGRVDGICACGRRLKNIKCPHQHTELSRDRRSVLCTWCKKALIGGAGIVDNRARKPDGTIGDGRADSSLGGVAEVGGQLPPTAFRGS
jgi:hypothetical protein